MTTDYPDRPRLNDLLIRPVLPGLFLAVLTLPFGFALGVVFDLDEEIIRGRLAGAAVAAPAAAYHQDSVAVKAVLAKSWTYIQRAHLHAGSLGAVAVGLSVILVLLGVAAGPARIISIGAGAGGLGYSVFWLLAGFKAPGLGSTGAAKESLSRLATPSSGLVVAGAVAVLLLLALVGPRRSP